MSVGRPSFAKIRLGVHSLCLVVALATACTFDASRLRASASPSADGAIEYPAVPDAATDDPPAAGLGDSGEAGAQAGNGGSTHTDAAAASPDLATAKEVAVSDDLALAPDLPTAVEVAFPAEANATPDAETEASGKMEPSCGDNSRPDMDDVFVQSGRLQQPCCQFPEVVQHVFRGICIQWNVAVGSEWHRQQIRVQREPR